MTDGRDVSPIKTSRRKTDRRSLNDFNYTGSRGYYRRRPFRYARGAHGPHTLCRERFREGDKKNGDGIVRTCTRVYIYIDSYYLCDVALCYTRSRVRHAPFFRATE